MDEIVYHIPDGIASITLYLYQNIVEKRSMGNYATTSGKYYASYVPIRKWK